MIVSLDKIKVKEQARKHFDETELRSLAESIRTHGLLMPLLVTLCGVFFELVAGERRLRAMRIAGIKECEVIVLRDKDAGDIETIQWIENAHRADLLPAEKAKNLAGIKQKKGWTNKELAEHLQMDPSLPGKYLSLFDTIAAVQEAADAGKIGLAAWYQISLLPHAEQPALLDMHLAGMPAGQIAQISRKKRKAASTAAEIKVSRVKCPLPSGATVTISGEAISLEDMIETMQELLKKAKRASDQGWDCKTFERACKDEAKAR